MELAIDYRIYYKLMSSNVTPNTMFLNSPGITTSVLTNPKNNAQQKHVTKWHEVTFPREWNLTPPVKQLESSNASIYEDMRGKINTKRPMKMLRARELKGLYAQTKTCESIEELEKIMNEISQIQLGKNKRKILPYQAAKDEPPRSSSMDTGDGERKFPPDGGHTIIQNITNNPTKIIREKNIKLPKKDNLLQEGVDNEVLRNISLSNLNGDRGIAEKVRDLLRKQCTENKKSKTAKKQLRGVENMCPKILDTPTQWGCHIPTERNHRRKFSGTKHNKKFASKKKYKFRKRPEYNKEQSSQTSPRKRFFKRKKMANSSSREVKKCRCWLCKADGHYANECPKKDKRSSKALIAEYDEAIEYANLKSFEVAYSDEENESIYSLEYPSDSETESASESSEEEDIGYRHIFLL
ncbi:hypothetical protein ACLB2K_023018 [Fragaria x ananassa]